MYFLNQLTNTSFIKTKDSKLNKITKTHKQEKEAREIE